MRNKIKYLILSIMLIITFTVSAASKQPDSIKHTVIPVELFLSSTCPHCHKADQFFKTLETQYPWLKVKRFVVNEDKSALLHFNEVLSAQHMSDFAVPSVVFCDSRWLGFASDDTTGKTLLSALEYCKNQIDQQGKLTPAANRVLKNWANASLFDTGMIDKPQPIKYLTGMAVLDALSPCAYFGLLGLLAFLLIQPDTKERFKVGLFYLLVFSLMHYFQQVYSSAYLEWLTVLRWPALILGIYSLYLLIPGYGKQAGKTVTLVLAFAAFISLFQQTCIMNWSNVFEQWLHHQQFSDRDALLYQLGYQSFYFISLCVVWVVLALVLKYLGTEKRVNFLNRVGMLYLIIISLLFIVYPYALASYLLSLLVFVLPIVIVWLEMKYKNNV